MFVGRHIFFCITTNLPLVSMLRIGEFVAIYQIYLSKCCSLSCSSRVSDTLTLNLATIHPSVPPAVLVEVDARVDDL
jgi:hypothetical protein